MKTKILAQISNKSIARVFKCQHTLLESFYKGFKLSEHPGVLLGDWLPTNLKIVKPSSSRLDPDSAVTVIGPSHLSNPFKCLYLSHRCSITISLSAEAVKFPTCIGKVPG
jgi:hypothetical protein